MEELNHGKPFGLLKEPFHDSLKMVQLPSYLVLLIQCFFTYLVQSVIINREELLDFLLVICQPVDDMGPFRQVNMLQLEQICLDLVGNLSDRHIVMTAMFTSTQPTIKLVGGMTIKFYGSLSMLFTDLRILWIDAKLRIDMLKLIPDWNRLASCELVSVHLRCSRAFWKIFRDFSSESRSLFRLRML